jgi:ceramide glucosyltransferase
VNELAGAAERWLPVAVECGTALLALCGLGYYCAALLAARAYAKRVRRARAEQDGVSVHADGFCPAVSVLKPLRGVDAGMMEAFASHCRQHYAGEYEIVFGAHPDDAGARAAVHELQRNFPEQKISLVECPESLGPNGKVSTLAQMVPFARHNFYLINDSDIFVKPDYLRRVMDGFADPGAGMVTAFYSGRCVADARGKVPLWAKLEALTVSTEFVPGALLAMQIDGGIQFALGGTLAIRREVLEQIGGFAALVDSLADDYEMGVRTIAAGHRVVMAPETVETAVPAYSFRQYVAHQLRWMRTVRDARPWGYAGLPFTFGLLWAVAAVIASAGAVWSWPLLSMALLARLALALSVGVGVLGDVQVLRDFWLIPLRDAMGAWMWIWSFASDDVEWRGARFHLHKGRLTRI